MDVACDCGDQADASERAVFSMLSKNTKEKEVASFNWKTKEACLKENNNNEICNENIMNCFKLSINNSLISPLPSYIYSHFLL